MSELKAIPRSLPARPSVKELVAEGFAERQRIREERRKLWNEKSRRNNTRMKALEAALTRERNSAIQRSTEVDRAKLPNPKAGGAL